MAHTKRPYRTRLYRNGASQAVRIPRDLAYPEDHLEVELVRRGDEVIIRPAERQLTGLGAALRQMGAAMRGYEREDDEHQERDWGSVGRHGDN